MIDHFETPDPSHTIITADRGYESYDLIAHLREKGLRFVLKAKDYTTPSSLLAFYKEEYPDSPEFDVTIKRFISNSKDREILDNPSIYKYVKPAKDLPHIKFGEESGLYYLQFRVVRIEIREGVYECLITNLPAWEFPKEKLMNILVSGNLDSGILETDIPEEGNSLIGLFTTYQVVRYCQAQSRFAVL